MIQDLTNMFKWRHIPGNMNPADIISRGLMPQEMKDCAIWWNGPEFFRLPKSEWPESIITVNEDDPEIAEEMKKVLTSTTVSNFFVYIENHRSSANKTRNIFAYIWRFVNNVRKRRDNRQIGGLTIEEMQNAEIFIVKVVQSISFPHEYKLLQTIRDNNEVIQQVSKKSSLIALSPFMDSKGILRVRGRLDASNELTYDQKHQIILPSCNFAAGIIRDFHQKYMHPTKSTLKSLIFQKFWIIKAKNTIKRIQHECIKCFRVNPQTVNQLMGNLPKARIKLTTPFVNTAVDYTGFYMIKTSSTRNSSAIKAYVVVFKCMCTGAIHLDVATDLSSQAFIAVLDRFVSRRGLCAEMFTDNATCFQGANNVLKKIVNEMIPAINQYCAEKMIKWNFTTPRSPSAGGIYESGVKLMKHHLKRILDRPYTYEKFYTILCKIEAVLNSRPLIPLSEDPNDFQVLTPGHFLIGRPLTALPEVNTVQMKTQLMHWKGLQQIQQKFWQLWYRDYLHLLQTRPSGFREERKIKIGELVLLKDDNLPPMRWMLGRIIQMFPGKDQVVRNVRIKTQHGEHERNVRQICPLPIEESSGQARECVSELETLEI